MFNFTYPSYLGYKLARKLFSSHATAEFHQGTGLSHQCSYPTNDLCVQVNCCFRYSTVCEVGLVHCHSTFSHVTCRHSIQCVCCTGGYVSDLVSRLRSARVLDGQNEKRRVFNGVF